MAIRDRTSDWRHDVVQRFGAMRTVENRQLGMVLHAESRLFRVAGHVALLHHVRYLTYPREIDSLDRYL